MISMRFLRNLAIQALQNKVYTEVVSKEIKWPKHDREIWRNKRGWKTCRPKRIEVIELQIKHSSYTMDPNEGERAPSLK